MGNIDFLRRIVRKISRRKEREWRELEYFDSDWKNRIQIMSQFIKNDDVVCDLGCGEMWLRDYLSKDCVYIPVDYTRRDENTLVFDFNKGEFPELKVNVGFLSGCFEYIKDYAGFVNNLNRFCDRVVISYVSLDLQPDINRRRNYAWKNHLDRNQFLKIFIRNGFRLEESITNKFSIYHFIKDETQNNDRNRNA